MGNTPSRVPARNDYAESRAALDQRDPHLVSAEAQRELDILENIRIDIAVTGVTGVGKSSLVNALRGMSDEAEGAAKTGCVETTKKPKAYQYPTFPRLTIWDLPGIETPAFDPQQYLRLVDFKRYDFFIIVSSERFMENDATLAREIRRMNKRFYYVRTKIDTAIASERRKKAFCERATLEEIRRYCCEHLWRLGESSPKVFLISRWDLDAYDFPLLQETIEKEQEDLKRDALITFMPVLTKESLRKKRAAMESFIWQQAVVSCIIGLTPVPGLSLICDVVILAGAMKHVLKAFGLDEGSLCILAERVGKPTGELKSAIRNCPRDHEITAQFVMELLKRSVVWGTLTVIEVVLNYIPVVGSLFGGGNSFITTFCMLNDFLKAVMKDAENLHAKVAER